MPVSVLCLLTVQLFPKGVGKVSRAVCSAQEWGVELCLQACFRKKFHSPHACNTRFDTQRKTNSPIKKSGNNSLV